MFLSVLPFLHLRKSFRKPFRGRAQACLLVFVEGDQKELSFAYPVGDGSVKLRCVADCGIFECYFGDGEIYYPVRTDEHKETLTVRREGDVAVTVTSLARGCYR